MSLIFKILRKFGQPKAQAILIKDFPALGYEGQIVLVKPGYAKQFLYKNEIAIPNFPGLQKRLYPDLKDELLNERKENHNEILNFNKRIKNVKVEIHKIPSFTNPSLMKEEISAKDIAEEINGKYGWDIEPSSVQLDKNITKFGDFDLEIKNFFHKKFKFTYDFPFKLKISPQKLVGKVIKRAGSSASSKIDKKEDDKHQPKEKI